jgi:hypothetical protein
LERDDERVNLWFVAVEQPDGGSPDAVARKQGQMRITHNNAAHRLLAVALCIVASTPCMADSFDTFDDHEKLQDQVILAVGSVSDFAFPRITSTNPLAMDNQLGLKPSAHKIGQYCFLSGEPMSGNAYMLLADRSNSVSIASLSSYISSVKIKIQAVTLVDCGQLTKAEHDAFTRDADNLKRQIELQVKQNKAMMDAITKQQKQLQKMQQSPQ